jgi:N-acetylglucosamine-6-phosphate deacetylase
MLIVCYYFFRWSWDRITGEHLPNDLITAVIKAKGINNVIVTSDAAPVAGLPSGNYLWGKTPVRVKGNSVKHGM